MFDAVVLWGSVFFAFVSFGIFRSSCVSVIVMRGRKFVWFRLTEGEIEVRL